MSRYQALRKIGLAPFGAAFLAFLNWAANVPEGLIVFMTLTIEYEAAPARLEKEQQNGR